MSATCLQTSERDVDTFSTASDVDSVGSETVTAFSKETKGKSGRPGTGRVPRLVVSSVSATLPLRLLTMTPMLTAHVYRCAFRSGI